MSSAKIVCSYPAKLCSNYSIEDAWTSPSSTVLLNLYDTNTNTLQPFEYLHIDSLNSQFAVISGYYYLIIDTSTLISSGSWGLRDTTQNLVGNEGYNYTLLLRDNSKQCDSISVTSLQELQSHLQVNFYPNPVNDQGELSIFSDKGEQAVITLLDIDGRKVKDIYNGMIGAGNTKLGIDMQSLSTGLYIASMTIGDMKKSIKISKL